MCEDEDKTVIKKRDAQGSESKRPQNLKNAISKAETSAVPKTREEAAISKQSGGHQERERESCTLETTPVQATVSAGSPSYPDTGLRCIDRPPTCSGIGLEVCGKFGVLNWPRPGVELLLGRYWVPP